MKQGVFIELRQGALTMRQPGARAVSIHGRKLSAWVGRALLGGLLGTDGFNPQFLQADGHVCTPVYMLMLSAGQCLVNEGRRVSQLVQGMSRGFCLTCLMIKRLGRVKKSKSVIRREDELLLRHQHVVL